MEYSDADPTFRARFLEPKFDPNTFLQSIALKSVGSTDLVNVKGRMHLISSEVKADLKQNIYRNHTKFIETAKQMTALESEVYQLHSLLADERQLINTVKDFLTVEKKSDVTEKSDSDSWETLLHHCQSLGLVSSNSDRHLVHSGKLLEAKLENLSASPHYEINESNKSSKAQPCYGLLFNDCFILVKSTNIRTATAYDVDQVIKIHRNSLNFNDKTPHSSSSSAAIQIINNKDDLLRNSFSIKYNLDTFTLICDNAHLKKHWIEVFESVLYRDPRRYSTARSELDPASEEDFYAEEWVRNIQEDLTILLAERNFDQALLLIRRARVYIQQFLSQHDQHLTTFVEEYTRSVQEKEHDLSKLIEKEILYICERGCSTNLLKHYYHHIQILKQLGRVSKACELFFTIQFSLMKTTLKQTKLEELNVLFVENFANTFFARLVDSYYEFVQIFQDQKSTFTKFIIWMAMEIEKLIAILHHQQYIGTRNFSFSMKNIEILLSKAEKFSMKLIDVKFIFEEQLEQSLVQIIRAQKTVIIDALRQRHRDEKWIPIIFQTRERLDQLFDEFDALGVDSHEFLQPFIHTNDEDHSFQVDLAASTLQFTKAYLTFARDLLKAYCVSVNHIVVEALVELIKLHLKYYERILQKSKEKDLKIHVDQLYRAKVGNATKSLTKVYGKMKKLKELAEN